MRKEIQTEKFVMKPKHIWADQWLLLTSGDFAQKRFNAMTVGWGSAGFIWGLPFVQVVVRPHRYTFEFMERYETFTVCAFPDRYRGALQLLGSKSGKAGDKIVESGLTPAASTRIAAPSYAEAELVLECRKIYWDDLKPDHFLDGRIQANYPKKDYHRIYYGEIIAVLGESKYQ